MIVAGRCVQPDDLTQLHLQHSCSTTLSSIKVMLRSYAVRLLFLGSGFPYVAPLPLPSECWGWSHISPCPPYVLFIFIHLCVLCVCACVRAHWHLCMLLLLPVCDCLRMTWGLWGRLFHLPCVFWHHNQDVRSGDKHFVELSYQPQIRELACLMCLDAGMPLVFVSEDNHVSWFSPSTQCVWGTELRSWVLAVSALIPPH